MKKPAMYWRMRGDRMEVAYQSSDHKNKLQLPLYWNGWKWQTAAYGRKQSIGLCDSWTRCSPAMEKLWYDRMERCEALRDRITAINEGCAKDLALLANGDSLEAALITANVMGGQQASSI